MHDGFTPPHIPRALAALIHPRYREETLGDLVEEFVSAVRPRLGRLAGGTWLVVFILRSAVSSHWHAWRSRTRMRSPPRERKGRWRMNALWQDLRFATRTVVRQPLYATVAVVTLGLGVGATTAMFTVVNGVLLRPLPYHQPDRLVHVQRGANPGFSSAISYPAFAAVRDGSTVFGASAAWQGWLVTAPDPDGALHRRSAASVSRSFFELLGVEPALGTFFGPADGDLGHAPVVVLSYGLWQREFGGRSDVVGRTVVFDGTAYTVRGVAAPGFEDPVALKIGAGHPEVWRARPPAFDENRASPTWYGFWMLGRLRDGVALERAQADVRSVARRFHEQLEDGPRGQRFEVVGLRDALVGGVRPTVLALLTAVVMVLLIACANVANLLLSRGTARGQEIAVRTALGAGRSRLIAQLLTESAIISVASTAIGLALALWGSRALVQLAGRDLPRAGEVSVDITVLVFALLLSILTTVGFGLAPALHMTDGRFIDALREGGRGGTGGATPTRLRHGFVIAQTALAVMLLVGSGLLIKSLWTLQRVDAGIDPESVLTMRISYPSATYGENHELAGVTDRVVERIGAVSSVVTVGAISDLPMGGRAVNSTPVQRDDVPPVPPGEARFVPVRTVTPDYFRAIGMRMLRGRGFTEADRKGANEVAVINQALADHHFPEGDPIGRRVTVRGVSRQIVGVVNDVRLFGLARAPDLQLFTPYAQEEQSWMRRSISLVMRIEGDPLGATDGVRRAVREVGPTIPITRVRTMASVVSDDIATPRYRALLFTLFAMVATVLAAVGIAGVMAYTVSQRAREIALRQALGAEPRAVLTLIVGQSARLTLVGVVLGLGGALAVSRFLATFLFGVPPTDVPVFVGVAVMLTVIALLASAVPAIRAMGIEPAGVLRAQ